MTDRDGSDAMPVNFTSDNIVGASPEILQAIAAINDSVLTPYGGDEYTAKVVDQLRQVFESSVSAYFVTSGTAANALALSVLTPPWGSILCAESSHINNSECAAPEFYTSGAKLEIVRSNSSKIDTTALDEAARSRRGDFHASQPSCVSIVQPTDTGEVYTVAEVKEISKVCKKHGLTLHMDGSRFANALVTLGCTPADITWKAGVDVLSFGATKNGALCAEAVVLFNSEKSRDMDIMFRRKRAGLLLSKGGFLAAQIDAYLSNDLWLRNARSANAKSIRLLQGLRKIPGVEVLGDPQSNIVFCKMPQSLIDSLHSQGFKFLNNRWGQGVSRLVTSYRTTDAQIDAFLAAACK